MIEGLKAFAKRHWPPLHLRTILFAVLFFTAAMPAIGAVFLRVYENTLVRQTEAELVAQSAALTSAIEVLWPGAVNPAATPPITQAPGYYRPYNERIDLSVDEILPERPSPRTVAPEKIDPQALLTARQVGPMIDATTRTTLASVLLIDRSGRVVRGVVAGADYSGLPEVRALLSGESRTVLRRNGDYRPRYSFEWLSRASALRVHYATPIVVNGEVVGGLLSSRSARALFRGIYEDRGKIILGVVVIFGVLVLLAGLISRGVTRPIEGLSAATRQVAAGRGEIPDTPATAAIEIRQLYEDFREMAQTIALRSRYLKDFAAALSHEFKTPLAGIAGAVELLEDHHSAMSDEERRRFLSNISADTARLSKLVSRLLELARADMTMPETSAATAVQEAACSVAGALQTPAFKVVVDLANDLPPVNIPTASLEAVLTILIENSRQAGASTVKIEGSHDAGAVILTVVDDGRGVPQADLARIFEPFFTGRRAEGGSGLGLPIAKSLLAAARAEIVAAASASGARFELRLPAAT